MVIQTHQIFETAAQNTTSILDLLRQDQQRKRDIQAQNQKLAMNNERIQAVRQDRVFNAIKNKFDLLSDREKMREQSLYMGALQVKPLLDAGDTQGALDAIKYRRDRLAELGIDTSNTDKILQQLQSGDVQGVQRLVNAQIQVGNIVGMGRQVDRGGGTGVLIDRLQQDRQVRGLPPLSFEDALLAVRGLSEGRVGIERDIAGARKIGQLGAEAQGRPDVIRAEKQEERQQEAQNMVNEMTQSIDNLVEDLDMLLADPALDSIVGVVDAQTPDLTKGARRAATLLDRIRSKNTLEAASALKGTLSDRDIELLKTAADELVRSVDEKDFRANAKKLRRRALDSLDKAQKISRGEKIESRFLGRDATQGTTMQYDDPLGLFK